MLTEPAATLQLEAGQPLAAAATLPRHAAIAAGNLAPCKAASMPAVEQVARGLPECPSLTSMHQSRLRGSACVRRPCSSMAPPGAGFPDPRRPGRSQTDSGKGTVHYSGVWCRIAPALIDGYARRCSRPPRERVSNSAAEKDQSPGR